MTDDKVLIAIAMLHGCQFKQIADVWYVNVHNGNDPVAIKQIEDTCAFHFPSVAEAARAYCTWYNLI
jgi:hypothetical protein